MKVPAHAVHTVAPVRFEYAPAGHETHAAAELAPNTLEYAPAEQFVHTLAPVTSE